jgi:tRNA threonylcarbamoyladenosine biosynthesis protein TsaB
MLGLVLETSTERGIVGAFNGQTCLFCEQLPIGLQNSQLVLPLIQQKIKEKIFQLADLSYIAVGIGPGSYTGIRVGATIGKSLAFALEIPLIGICTLDAFIPESEGVFAALIDAKIGGVYLQISSLKGDVTDQILTSGAYSLVKALEKLETIPKIVTPNAEKIKTKLEALKPDAKWEWQECYPNARKMMRIALYKMENNLYAKDQSLDLLYMRKTQAEIEKGY